MLASISTDIRYGVRRLAAAPAFCMIVVSTLALGIGASTAIFSAVRPILVDALPYPQPDRLVSLTDRAADGSPLDLAYGTLVEVEARSRTFGALAVLRRWQPALADDGEAERLAGDWVSADYFRVLGVLPIVGRNFTAGDFDVDDAEAGGTQAAIVSSALAERRFGGARAALGTTLRLDDVPHIVIGVMPPGFENALSPDAEIWAPLQYRRQAAFDSREWGHHLRMIGRLAPEVSLEQASAELATIGRNPLDEYPRPPHASMENGLDAIALQTSLTAGARPLLLGILGAVSLLLVIACANVTNLLLARSIERRGELAVRSALGATRPRLVRQLLTETALLAVTGGTVGLGVALAGIELIVALAPAGLPRIEAVRLDVPSFVFAIAVTTLVGPAVGLAPALRYTSSRFELRAGTRITGGSHATLLRGLVVTQVALALVLLAGAGLLVRSVERLLATPPGFDAANLVTMQIVATGRRFESEEAALQFFRSALDAIQSLPGVIDASLTNQLPLSGDFDAYGVRFESSTEDYASNGALRYTVTPEWFRTMRIPLREGRLFDASDRPGAPGAVVLGEAFAKRRFGTRSPLGERLRIGPDPEGSWRTVVGVVGDVKQASLGLAAPDAFYVPLGQWPRVDVVQSLVVRTDRDPAALVPLVQETIWSIDAVHPLARVTTMQELVAASAAERRFALAVLALFAAAALVLAALGLYGVMAGRVAERVREIGLRAALGASPGEIGSLVVRQGMALAGLGTLIGAAGAAAVTRGLSSLLYGVTPLDPVTYVLAILLLGAVTAAACWVPARRATRTDPVLALRAE